MKQAILMPFLSILALITLVSVATTAPAATVEKHDLPAHGGFYLLFKPDKPAPKEGYDLLVVLHGAGDTAQNFAQSWKHLVDKRSNLLLAVPQGTQPLGPGFTWAQGHVKYITSVITDAVANCGVNPRHVMLVGFSAGGSCGFNVLASVPQLLACFGGVATGLPNGINDLYEKKMKKAAEKVSVYYAVGTQDATFGDAYNDVAAKLKGYGFNLKTERPNCAHTVTPDEIKNMMEFFDAVLKKNDEAKPATPAKSESPQK